MSGRSATIVLAGVASILAVTLPGARAPEEQSKDALLTAEVKKQDLSIEVELAGSFVAEDKDEIRLEPKSYRGDLIIVELVPEGRAVKKGDTLISFDRKTLQDSLDEANEEVRAKDIELEKARADLAGWEIDQQRKKTRAEAERDKARAALAKVKEQAELTLVDKKKGVEDAERRVKDAEVDFEQLTQLYEERELHTATENILVERQKHGLDDTRRSATKTAREFDLWDKYEKDIDAIDKQLDFDDKDAAVKKGEIQASAERKEKDAAVSKAERAHGKAKDKVAELEQDVESLRVLAPRDGIVFYGTIGSDWPSDYVIVGMDNQGDQMKIGGRVRTHQVLMTVASMERLSVRMQALESDIQYLKEGLPITVRPDAFPALEITGELTKVDQVASRTGFFSDVRQFNVLGKYDKAYPQLRSGMNCRVTVKADSVPECLQVPVLAVFSEGGKHHCMRVDGNKTSKVEVTIGSTNGTNVEIQDGLQAGDRVALHDPSAG
jgi:multidrug efflux pump subunit AcrA (membrane-fusion protein)